MLTRLYVDNYRCLVDFEFKPKPVQLLLGTNGSGKSSLFDILDALRRIVVDGLPARKFFGPGSRTTWATSAAQRFAIDLGSPGGQVQYSLTLSPLGGVIEERVALDGDTTLHIAKGHLVRSEPPIEPQAATVEFRNDRSAVSGINSPSTLLLRAALDNIIPVQINPWVMTSRSEHAASRPSRDLANLSDWFRHLAQEDPVRIAAIINKLAVVLPGLQNVAAAEAGLDVRVIRAHFRRPSGGQFAVGLSKLSEGQRALIALYMLISKVEPDSTLLFDEPENFIALSEIQPWLLEAKDSVEEAGAQLIVASHHPEIVNMLAEDALVLHRDDAGPTRISAWSADDSGLGPSEIIARGWERA